MNKRNCPSCQNDFEITPGEVDLLARLAPTLGGQRVELPLPVMCPGCRQQRRACFRNERKLYHDICDLCGKNIISLYSQDKPYKVYCQPCWWGDGWDAQDFARDYDPARSFFEQLAELQMLVPRVAIFNLNSENSEYTNHSAFNKNCYMGVAIGNSQDCMYGHWVLHSRQCVDSLYLDHCQECYQCSYCRSCYRSYYCQHSFQLQNCFFCYECRNCENCLGCVNGQHLKFHILNTPASAKEVERKKMELQTSRAAMEEFKQAYEALRLSSAHRPNVQVNCENCSGNDLYNCRESYNCYNCRELEFCFHMFDLGSNKYSMDCYEHGWLVQGELNYQCHAGMAGYNLLFCNICADSRRLLYCDLCFNDCSDCLGCISLRKKRHCILNKPYSESDYEELAWAVVCDMQARGEWGGFIPAQLSPFGYNETAAFEYFPLERSEMEQQGFKYCDYRAPAPQSARAVKAAALPTDIRAVTDQILEGVLLCDTSGKPFKITKPELDFYRTHGLPLPLHHPEERHAARMAARYPRFVWERQCAKCKKDFQSSVPPHCKEVVYCESCFMQAFY